MAWSAGSFRSRATLSLERLTLSKYVELADDQGGPQVRVSSPAPGLSTLTTVAPRSARFTVHNGPASTRLKSATSTPSRGPAITVSGAGLVHRQRLPCRQHGWRFRRLACR